MDRERLHSLASLRSEKHLVISLYLPLEKGEVGEAKLPIRLKNLINEALEAKGGWTPEQIRSVEEDLPASKGWWQRKEFWGERASSLLPPRPLAFGRSSGFQ